jgi:hypothetical protein
MTDYTCDECSYSFDKNNFNDLARLSVSYQRAINSHWSSGIKILANTHDVLRNKPRWSQAKTAKTFGISPSAMSLHLNLFAGIVKYPHLKECNTADEARNKLKLLESGSPALHIDYEKKLQEKIIEHWNELDLLIDWEFAGQYYKLDEKNILDIFAKHKTEDKWLVIELKRNKSSDHVIGQILRYMGMLKELKKCQAVLGAVISHDPDDDIFYAVHGASNIFLWAYGNTKSSLVLKEYDRKLKPSLAKILKSMPKEILRSILSGQIT